MHRPTVSHLADALYEDVGPLTDGDEARGWPLLKFCDALTAPFLQTDEVISDREDGTEGWTVALNPNLVPAWAFPWFAQFHGVQLRPGLTDAEQRAWVSVGGGFNRGTLDGIRAATQATLTGTRHVDIYERAGGAYRLLVTTWTSQTPDPAATESALRAAVPAGLVVTYEARAGQSLQQLEARVATLGDIETTYSTLQAVQDHTN